MDYNNDCSASYDISIEGMGVALIFLQSENNHVHRFLPELIERGNKDVALLKKMLKTLHYKDENVHVFENLTKMKILTKLETFKCHTKNDMFMCIVLAVASIHGNIETVDKRDLDVFDIYVNFSSRHCEDLINKPKMFIFQLLGQPHAQPPPKHSKECDTVLLASSDLATDKSGSSLFIKTLCDEVAAGLKNSTDILTIFTWIIGSMHQAALERNSDVTPFISSSMTKLLTFPTNTRL